MIQRRHAAVVIRRLTFALGPPERGVVAIPFQQLAVGPGLDNLAAVQHTDPVRIDDRRQPVGDHQAGMSLGDLRQRRQNRLFRLTVQ